MKKIYLIIIAFLTWAMLSVSAFTIDVIVVSLRAKVLLKFKNFWSLEFVVVGSAKYNKESLHKLPFLIKWHALIE